MPPVETTYKSRVVLSLRDRFRVSERRVYATGGPSRRGQSISCGVPKPWKLRVAELIIATELSGNGLQ
jgi:hypothetical protein